MKVVGAFATLAAAEAATLAVTWEDCGAQHATVTDLQPTSIETGSTTTLTGVGTTDEDVTSAQFSSVIKAHGVTLTKCSGDATTDIECKLPLGAGKIVVKAVDYPIAQGEVDINVEVSTSSIIPAQLAAVDVEIRATEQGGEDVICMNVHTKKQQTLQEIAAATIPTHKLNNGVDMPMMSIGTWQYDTATAEQVVKDALATGFNHIDTANNYRNQKGVGAALKGVDRDSYFLTTKIPDGSTSQTKAYLEQDLEELGVDYVDLMLVHYPPRGNSCSSMQEQWAAMEEFYKDGKAKAIGVSNYCPSSLECIMQTATVTPAVNQVQYHVGMGVDPINVKSASEKYGIHLQAYSPLGNGQSDLITGDLVTTIGAKYDKTGAQVALRWIQENGVSLTTKTTKTSHMQQDLDVFTFQLSAEDKASLDAATKPSGSPSFMCSKLAEEVAV